MHINKTIVIASLLFASRVHGMVKTVSSEHDEKNNAAATQKTTSLFYSLAADVRTHYLQDHGFNTEMPFLTLLEIYPIEYNKIIGALCTIIEGVNRQHKIFMGRLPMLSKKMLAALSEIDEKPYWWLNLRTSLIMAATSIDGSRIDMNVAITLQKHLPELHDKLAAVADPHNCTIKRFYEDCITIETVLRTFVQSHATDATRFEGLDLFPYASRLYCGRVNPYTRYGDGSFSSEQSRNSIFKALLSPASDLPETQRIIAEEFQTLLLTNVGALHEAIMQPFTLMQAHVQDAEHQYNY